MSDVNDASDAAAGSAPAALNAAILSEAAAARGLDISPAAIAQFEHLARELVDRNTTLNLTRLVSPDEIAIQHILDSLVGLPLIEEIGPAKRKVVDVGSGAGFPGLALAIVRPAWQVTLVDARTKVVDWLRHAATALELTNVVAVHARAEDLGRDKTHRQRYDLSVARALAPLPTLLELTLPLVHTGGYVVAWKGVAAEDEITASANALSLLGGKVARRFHYHLPGLEHERVLVVIEKRRATQRVYPRQAGTPGRKPL